MSLTTGSYTVTFKAVEGYTTPVAQPVSIANDQTTTVSAEYFEIVLPDEQQGVLKVTISGTPEGQWSIDAGTTWNGSGQSLKLDPGTYTVTYKEVTGFTTPGNESATVADLEITMITAIYVSNVKTSDPTAYGMEWDNGTEPTLEGTQKIIYVTPTGAGGKTGVDWANAKAGLYAAVLAATSGDVIYMQEGTYTAHYAPIENKSLRIYGGFDAEVPTWAGRDGWTHRTTIDAVNNSEVFFANIQTAVNLTIDGLCFKNFQDDVINGNGAGETTVKTAYLANARMPITSTGRIAT